MALISFRRYQDRPYVRVEQRPPMGARSFARYFFMAYAVNGAPVASGGTDQIPGDADFERDLQTFHDLLALSYQP